MIAILDALKKDQRIIRPFPINVTMDHFNIPFFLRNAERTMAEPWGRYSMYLNQYDHKISFGPGVNNYMGDAMSRITDTALKALQQPTKNGRSLKSLFPKFLQSALDYVNSKTNPELPLKFKQGIPKQVSLASVLSIQPEIVRVSSENYNQENAVILPNQTINISSINFATVELKDIKNDQQSDNECKGFMERLRNKSHPKHQVTKKNYRMIQGILHFRTRKFLPDDKKDSWVQFLPKCRRKQIMNHFHGSQIGAHPGIKPTLTKIKRTFYWPTMQKDIRKWVKNCNGCIRAKAKLQAIPYLSFEVTSFLDAISIDYLGPINNKYILVIVIISTGWVEAKVCSHANAKNAADGVWELVICRYGSPRKDDI